MSQETSGDDQRDVTLMSFEEALGELEDIVRRLEAGETDLEGAITAYERGVTLKKFCEEKLRQAQLRVERIESDAGGGVRAEPLDDG